MILFDLDGTLYQTHETSLPPLYDLCRKYNLTLSPEDSSFVLYSTIKALLDKIAPQMPFDQRSEFMAELKAQETEAIKKHGRLFDGIEELLSSLSNSGIEMAICSIGSKEYVETVLEHCNIKHYFKYITHRIGDRTKTEALKQLLQDSGKKPNECIMVGDSIIDLTAAVENNVPFIGVTYGYGARDLTQANALVDNAAQLKEVIYKSLIFLQIESALKDCKKPCLLGINGVDTSGKTMFSIDLEQYLKSRGHHVQLIHLDDFHNSRAVRSIDITPQGYLDNTFNLPLLSKLIREMKSHPVEMELNLLDLDSDCYTNTKTFQTTDETILILEGVALYRPPLDDLFDYKVFLTIEFDEVLRRAKERDVPKYGEAFLQKYIDKYIPAQKIYLEEFAPKEKCHLVIDNGDYRMPKIKQKLSIN